MPPLTFAPAPRDSRDDRDDVLHTASALRKAVTAVTVSYTHLDVYKRQGNSNGKFLAVSALAKGQGRRRVPHGTEPVSYTHLQNGLAPIKERTSWPI